MSKKQKHTILVLSDMHIPYNHQDMLPFLKEVKKKFKPNDVVCIGDEVDSHAMSFHDNDPDLMSAGDELQEAIEVLAPIYKLFPVVQLVHSNHGSMVYRKGKHHGIPRKYLRDYGDILEAPATWTWENEVKMKSGDKVIKFRHQWKKNILQAAQAEGHCLVGGHFHENFSIGYAGNSSQLLWGMTVGSLVDDDSMAFNYNKTFANRPLLGVGIIVDGLPQLVPMIVDRKGRWIGSL